MPTLAEYAQARALTDAQFRQVCEHAPDTVRADLLVLAEHRRVARSPRSLSRILTDGRELQAPHLDLIDQAVRGISEHRIDRLLLTCPPRHGKSRRVRWAALWYLMHNPERRIIIASHSESLAQAHGRWLRDTVDEHSEILGLRLSKSSAAAGRWDIDGTEGGVLCVGVGGGATGHGASLLLVDDPVKDAEQAESTRYQERAWDWWTAVAQTRLEPDGGAIVIQTRWSMGDLAGRILSDDPEEWEHLDIPALAFTEDEWTALGVTPRPDPLGRQPGEALWPDRYNTKSLSSIRRRVGERVWWALYQQQPRPVTGTLLSREDLLAQRVTPDEAAQVQQTRAAVAVDPSGGGRDEAGIVGGWLGTDKRLYITDDRSAPMATHEWSRQACLLAHELTAERIIIEQNFGRDQALLAVRTAWEALAREGLVTGLCPQLVAVHAKKGKLLRAEPIAGQWREDRIRIVGTLPQLEWQWTTWLPGQESPGRIDASVYLAYGLLPVPGSETVISSPARRAQNGRTGSRGARYGRSIGTPGAGGGGGR
ncbi:terminase large subunit domain-containing protein [Streptomyces sp. Iso 434]|uniref:terminase large subunit domain-containing protein n=1 Tax=Streptomyces sp. Iso 434 TaxID=3062272 RepID=UPI00397ECAB9